MEPNNSWKVFTALLFGTFVTIEAAAFQAPALPSVSRHFGIPINLAALVLILYFLGLTVFAPIMGRFGDQFGRKKVLMAGLLIFAAAEFAAAFAPNFGIFLAARLLQGLAVACILPGVFAYATHLFPVQKRGFALGVLTFTMTFGAASGGLLGGLLIDRLGWPSVYWISGALALVGLLPVTLLVPEIRLDRERPPFDFKGALLLFMTIAALLSLPTWATYFGRQSPLTWSIVAIGIGSLAMLWRNSKRAITPVVDVSILSKSSFALPCAIYWLHMLSFTAVVYMLAFFINTRPGGTAAQFGFVTLFLYGSAMISAPIAGRLIDKMNARTISIIALTGTLIGILLLLQIDVRTSLSTIILIVCILGLMIGGNTPSMMKLAFDAVPQQKIGAGTGFFSMVRDLGAPTGSSISLAVFGTTLTMQKEASMTRRGMELGLDQTTIEALISATGGHASLPVEVLNRVQASGIDPTRLIQLASEDGLNAALTNVCYLLAIMITTALLLSLRLARTSARVGAELAEEI